MRIVKEWAKRFGSAWIVPAVLVLAGSIAFAITAQPSNLVAAGLDRQTSSKGLYRVSLQPGVEPVPIGEIHTWLVMVTDLQGDEVDVEIHMDAEMPGHGHGLGATTKVVDQDVQGRHVVSGVRFDMRGRWLLKVAIEGPAGDDMVVLDLNL